MNYWLTYLLPSFPTYLLTSIYIRTVSEVKIIKSRMNNFDGFILLLSFMSCMVPNSKSSFYL